MYFGNKQKMRYKDIPNLVLSLLKFSSGTFENIRQPLDRSRNAAIKVKFSETQILRVRS